MLYLSPAAIKLAVTDGENPRSRPPGGQGWWQHEFCYRKHVKQIHRNQDGSTDEVLLGVWDPEYHKSKLSKMGNKRSSTSVTLYYKDGDFCEETKMNRKVCRCGFCGGVVRIQILLTGSRLSADQSEGYLLKDS